VLSHIAPTAWDLQVTIFHDLWSEDPSCYDSNLQQYCHSLFQPIDGYMLFTNLAQLHVQVILMSEPPMLVIEKVRAMGEEICARRVEVGGLFLVLEVCDVLYFDTRWSIDIWASVQP